MGYATAGVDPNYMGIGPIPAARRVLKRAGLRLEQIDLVELNEALASQVLACARELGIELDNGSTSTAVPSRSDIPSVAPARAS